VPVHRVLFVCEQNVCRSPYMAAVTSALMAGEDGHSFLVTSRGASARAAVPMCEVAEAHLHERGVPIGDSHRSAPLEDEDIRWADLILTATESQRSAVALLSPAARQRAFTVREAILLSDRHLSPAERAKVRATSRRSSLRAVTAIWNARRGTLHLPPRELQRRLGRRRASPESPLEIPDRHLTGGAGHRRLFAEMDADLDVLGARLEDAIGITEAVVSRAEA